MTARELEIKRIVEDMCTEYGTRSPFRLCEELDIAVIFCRLPDSVRGFYMYVDGSGIIYINQELTREESILVCAHELGHATLHGSGLNSLFLLSNTRIIYGRYERQADLFCTYLLSGDYAPDLVP